MASPPPLGPTPGACALARVEPACWIAVSPSSALPVNLGTWEGQWEAVPSRKELEQILREYLIWRATHLPVERLLFPSPGFGLESMVSDTRKALDRIGARAGWEAGEIRTKMFRHTYCAARLQTLDRGAPVSPYPVGKELGHGGTSMVERVYSHLGQVRHRSELVEFRVEQHHEVLRERLAGLMA